MVLSAVFDLAVHTKHVHVPPSLTILSIFDLDVPVHANFVLWNSRLHVQQVRGFALWVNLTLHFPQHRVVIGSGLMVGVSCCLLLSSVVVTFSAADIVRVPLSTVVDLAVALVDGPGFLSTSPAFNSAWDMISGPIMSPYKNTMMVQL